MHLMFSLHLLWDRHPLHLCTRWTYEAKLLFRQGHSFYQDMFQIVTIFFHSSFTSQVCTPSSNHIMSELNDTKSVMSMYLLGKSLKECLSRTTKSPSVLWKGMFYLGMCFCQCIIHFLLLVCTKEELAPPSNMLSLVWWCIILSRCNGFYQGPIWVSWEKWKKIKMLVRVGILLYVIISGEGLPLKTLLCHPSSSFVTLINAVAVGHYTLELGLCSLVCKVLCSALLPEP